MTASNMCEYVTPMVVVLDEIALCKTNAKTNALPRYSHVGHGEVARLIQNALYFQIAEYGLIQSARRKRVSLVYLQGVSDKAVCSGESRPDCRSASIQRRSIKIAENPVLAEILVDASVPL